MYYLGDFKSAPDCFLREHHSKKEYHICLKDGDDRAFIVAIVSSFNLATRLKDMLTGDRNMAFKIVQAMRFS